MQEALINETLLILNSQFTSKQLAAIKDAMCFAITGYDVKKKSTALVKYEKSIPDCLGTYLMTRKIEGLSDLTLKRYKEQLVKFFVTVRKPMAKICTTDIRAYLGYHQQETGCTSRTLDGIRSVIGTYFKWCAAEGYIKADPTANIKPIKYTKKQRGHLSDVEVEKLRQACTKPRDLAMFELFYSTGCRVSEVINIKLSDIDFDNCQVNVIGKGNKERTVYLNAKSCVALEGYMSSRGHDSEYVFCGERKPHKNLQRRQVESIFEKLGEKAGIKQKVYPHLIRHTSATHGLNHGMDVTQVQIMLGHANVSTTMVYAEVSEQAVKTSHAKCFN